MSEPTQYPVECPQCGRRFKLPEGVYAHMKAKHGVKAARAYAEQCHDPTVAAIAAKVRARDEQNGVRGRANQREPSMGEMLAEAQLNRAMGIPNEDWIEEMLP